MSRDVYNVVQDILKVQKKFFTSKQNFEFDVSYLQLYTTNNYITTHTDDIKKIDTAIARLVNIATIHQETIPLSLYGGIADICLILHYIQNIQPKYTNAFNTLNSIFQDKIHNILQYSNQEEDFDLINGISGFISYSMNINENKIYTESLLSKLIEHINKQLSTKKKIDLSLAHGLAGHLSILSKCYKNNIVVEHQLLTIQNISNLFLSILESSINNQIPTILSSPYSEKSIRSDIYAREGWCRGMISVGNSLILAGEALAREDIIKTGLLLISKSTNNSFYLQSGVISPSICHGLSGILCILKRISTKYSVIDIADNIKVLDDNILSFYNVNYPLNFQDIEFSNDGNSLKYNNNFSFLNGSTGIYLSLTYDGKKDSYIANKLAI